MANSNYCNRCGRSLPERYCVYQRKPSDKGLVLCPTCAITAPVCTVCGMPLGEGYRQLSDGRPVCADCHATAVDDPLKARLIYEQVVALAASELGLSVHNRPGFCLCTPAEMQALQQHLPRTTPRGLGGHLLGAYIKLERRREIMVERGLPQLMMTKVIAHEYGHAWQGENTPFLLDPQLLEGFCEWVAYKLFGVLGATEVQEIQRQRRGFYGDALRLLLALEAQGGVTGVLQAMRSPERGLQQHFKSGTSA